MRDWIASARLETAMCWGSLRSAMVRDAFKDMVTGPGSQALLLNCTLQRVLGLGPEFAMNADLASGRWRRFSPRNLQR
jgi:hypothetical protein